VHLIFYILTRFSGYLTSRPSKQMHQCKLQIITPCFSKKSYTTISHRILIFNTLDISETI